MPKEFRVVLRRVGDGDEMKMEFPDMDFYEGCWKLAQIAMCEEKGLLADGRNVGYFNNIFIGTNWKKLVRITMLSDMIPRFVFVDKSPDAFADIEASTLEVTLLPEKIEMFMTKGKHTEIVIKE